MIAIISSAARSNTSAAIYRVRVRFHLNKANTPGCFKLLRYKISQKADGLISLFSTTHQRRRVGICHLFLRGFCTSISPTGGLIFLSKRSPAAMNLLFLPHARARGGTCSAVGFHVWTVVPPPLSKPWKQHEVVLQSNCFFATFRTQKICFQFSITEQHARIVSFQQRLELLECMISSNTDNMWVENTKVWRDASTRMTSVWIPPMMRLLTLLLLLLVVKVQRSACSSAKTQILYRSTAQTDLQEKCYTICSGKTTL